MPPESAKQTVNEAKKKWLDRFVRTLETIGNRFPHPFTLFLVLAVTILILSFVLSKLGASASFLTPSSSPSRPSVQTTIAVKNLLSVEFMRVFLKRFVAIYVEFPPLGMAMAMMLGIGLLEKTGMISAMIRRTILKAPPYFMTALLAFVGINANLASHAGVILTPTIGAALFKAAGRNPWIGIAAGYAAASGGFSANLMVAGTDVVLSSITESTVKGMGIAAPVHPLINWYFMITATFVVTLVVTMVTERFLSRFLEDRQRQVEADSHELSRHQLTSEERRGLRWAGITAGCYLVVILLGTVPSWGFLRNPAGRLMPQSPLTEGIVAILFMFFVFTGVSYGYGSGRIKSQRDIPRLMEDGLRGVLSFMVVAMPAAYFIHFFNESRISTVLAMEGALWLQGFRINGAAMIVVFVLVTSVMNIFLTSGSAKWMVLAPIFVPIFASVALSPAFTQISFRVGDSATNIISPIKSYLPVIIGLLEQYRPKDKTEVGIGTVISLQIVYSFFLLISLVSLLLVFYLLDLPLGPGAPIRL